jgi:hypothetical protein
LSFDKLRTIGKAPCRRVCRSEPFDRLREGIDKLSPNGFGWHMLRFVANQERLSQPPPDL